MCGWIQYLRGRQNLNIYTLLTKKLLLGQKQNKLGGGKF